MLIDLLSYDPYSLQPVCGWLSAVIGAAGSLIGGAMANKGAKDAAATSNAFTKEQLQNRHQWEVADLKKAGLNPILSAGGTPSIGGSSTAQIPYNPAEAVNSALAAKRLEVEIDNIKADTRKKTAEERSVQEDVKAKGFYADIKDDLSNVYSSAKKIAAPLSPSNYLKSSSKALSRSGERIKTYGKKSGISFKFGKDIK